MFHHKHYVKFSVLSLLGFAVFVAHPAIAEEEPLMIEEGKQVSFTYTLSVEGDVVESNSDREPLVYTQGGGQILKALESELEGLQAGDQKTVNLDAASGYGELNEEAYQQVPIEQIPEEARIVGAMLQAQGYPNPIRVSEVTEEKVTLDFNHPLAGKDLSFDITIVTVENATPPASPPVN
jgi:FKBP-type peptidyl-prolyl cis-trans isomerase 2